MLLDEPIRETGAGVLTVYTSCGDFSRFLTLTSLPVDSLLVLLILPILF